MIETSTGIQETNDEQETENVNKDTTKTTDEKKPKQMFYILKKAKLHSLHQSYC